MPIKSCNATYTTANNGHAYLYCRLINVALDNFSRKSSSNLNARKSSNFPNKMLRPNRPKSPNMTARGFMPPSRVLVRRLPASKLIPRGTGFSVAI